MNVSEHLTLEEVTRSETAIKLGIKNVPTKQHLENLKKVAVNIYEPCRKKFGPIYVSCGYRSAQLNAITPGASSTSGHARGEALDLASQIFKNCTNKELFFFILENCEFNELIWEHGTDNEPAWVHVLYREGQNIKEVWQTYIKPDKSTGYKKFPFNKIKK